MNLKFKNSEFEILFDDTYFEKGDILVAAYGRKIQVTKRYRDPFWKKMLRFVGFHIPNKTGYYRVKSLIK